ncbi:hypothetical protein SOVF_103020, partial [Spinacia oleracea]
MKFKKPRMDITSWLVELLLLLSGKANLPPLLVFVKPWELSLIR